jgi:deoxycytidylate deaminase
MHSAQRKTQWGRSNVDKTGREAFVGLIAPIGVDLDAVLAALKRALKTVTYRLNEVRLTDIFRENNHWYDVKFTSEEEKYRKYIAAGDDLCSESGRKDVLALYGIAKLQKYSKRSPDSLPERVVHVFRQIKRVEEIKTLDEVFGRNALFVACYSPKKNRVASLVKKMLKTERGTSKSKLESKALEIIAMDEDERDNPHGQRIIECYPLADFVLDCTSHRSLSESAKRLIDIFFGSPFISPSVDEYASYIANAASYRSLDLSRQVGAAIFGKNCEIISVGCNEVPKAGGGTYWAGGDEDFRDYALGYDSNQKVREDMTRDALVRLQKLGWLSAAYADLTPDELVGEAFYEDSKKVGPLSRSMMKDIIEYGRMVHAEMNALTDAARFRRSTIGATLYCTTMPCHMCTKLIIASGIRRVVYIQPYGKSLIEELFDDSVAVDEHPEEERVIFDSLKGVTPNGFKRAFHKVRRRKNPDGTAESWDPVAASPIFVSNFAYYPTLEVKALGDLANAIKMIEARHPAQEKLALGKR